MKRTLQTILFALVAMMVPIGVSAQEIASDYAVVDYDAKILTIDGTFGGKPEVTDKNEITALVNTIQNYVESGGSAVIVTGGELAIYNGFYDNYPAYAEALYYVTEEDENSKYCGSIDLILPDVTEIGEYEFNVAFSLKSVTLPKVTAIGDAAFWGCMYLQTLTFGSVVTSIGSKVAFSDVGLMVEGGTNLVLNCGQMQTEGNYKPNLETNEWFYNSNSDKVYKWKSITLTHTAEADDGDCTTPVKCTTCGETVVEAKESHITEKDENKATCQHGNICDLCGAEYSEPDPDAHSYNEDGFCEMCSTANPDETMFFIFDGDHKAFNVAEDLVGVNIEYTRGLHNTEWNSLYLPFEVPVTEELLDEFEFAYVNDMHSADTDDNGEIDKIEMEIVKIKEGTLHANHPYFIRAKSEYTILQLSCENTTLHATKETTLNCSSIYMDYAIVGTYKQIKGTEFNSVPGNECIPPAANGRRSVQSEEPAEAKAYYYAISIDGGWWQIPEDSSLYPFRVYLSITARDGSPVKVSDEALRAIRFRAVGDEENGETTGIENSELKIENSDVIYDLQGRRVEKMEKGIYIVNGKKVIVK